MTQPLAFVFPGQGSQQVGMLRELAERYSVVRTTFEEAADALGYDLWKVVQEGPEESLNATACTQPALLTASVAIWRVWQELEGPRPGAMAGHSLGEYSAMVCAGVMGFADGVRLVRLRGEAMQEAVPLGQGGMAAILGLDNSAVEQACAAAAQGEVVAAVNYNAPGQVVIAGAKSAVERAIGLCQEAGAKRAMPLP
ncbi:MAG: acyltransferase domain-containing protein, partial [Halomonadaceae bacterium]|nr:acyltransferase domain-containing protein [Halomonadaceae bacterium]